MDIKGYCSQCEREFLTKHLVPLIDDLIKNKSAFREAFENKNPKFCRSCKRKWLELGKLKIDKVKDFIENMKSMNKKETVEDDNKESDTENQNYKTLHENEQNVSDTDLAVPGPSGMQNNTSKVTPATNDHLQEEENLNQDSFLNAKKERDHWYKLWIEGFCSDETGDEYQAKMKEYGRKWKELERKMNEINPEYEPLL